MATSKDQIFQLSLTEIAFTLVFVILLLLGWMVFKTAKENQSLHDKVASQTTIEAKAQEAVQVAEAAKKEMLGALVRAGVAKPDEIVSTLVSSTSWIAERERMRRQIADLDAQVSALAEIKDAISGAMANERDKAIQERIQSALALQGALRKRIEKAENGGADKDAGKGEVKLSVDKPNAKKEVDKAPAKAPSETPDRKKPIGEAMAHKDVPAQKKEDRDIAKEALAAVGLGAQVRQQMRQKLGIHVDKDNEDKIAGDLVGAFKEAQAKASVQPVEDVRRENANLRGQVAFYKGKLEARGGRDYPPCWADENTGKVEFLFSIEIHPDGLRVSPGWLAKRETDAKALPGIDQLITPSHFSLAEFNSGMQALDRDSKARGCRHYVYLKSKVNQLEVFNRYRYGVENFFYKLELRS